MPALEPRDQMEPITALDEDQQIPSPTKSDQDTNITVVNNNNSNTTNGESYNGITKYTPSTPPRMVQQMAGLARDRTTNKINNRSTCQL